MNLSAVPRRPLPALAAACLVGLLAGPAAAAGTPVGAPGLTIHEPERVLRDYCSLDAEGRLWLRLPGGARFELITSPHDPAIVNPGDGSFHPFDPAEVRAAERAVGYPLGAIAADVFVLPYPRRGGLESAAGPRLILLSPGVRPLSRQQQHAEFVHELGHVVQHALMPESDTGRWDRYRTLRGIQDETRYSAAAAHADRPREIFAEDFRALFGGALATATGTIENPSLSPPATVPGLAGFMLDLAGAPPPGDFAAFPNPTRGGVRFARGGGTPAPLDLFDAGGRRIAVLEPTPLPGSVEWLWDGRDAAGRALGPGVIFARRRGSAASGLRVTILR